MFNKHKREKQCRDVALLRLHKDFGFFNVNYSNFHLFRPQRLYLSAPGATLRSAKNNVVYLPENRCKRT